MGDSYSAYPGKKRNRRCFMRWVRHASAACSAAIGRVASDPEPPFEGIDHGLPYTVSLHHVRHGDAGLTECVASLANAGVPGVGRHAALAVNHRDLPPFRVGVDAADRSQRLIGSETRPERVET